jgi:cellulose synthase (UDP-forming)
MGLMGGAYQISDDARGSHLEAVTAGPFDLEVPAPDYVLTLDADSILLPEYCLRLVHVLAQPQSERIAVIQTPYSAFPGSSTRLERLAGASTDLQHISHQGMAHYGATFWVGANAVIRHEALADIERVEVVDGRIEKRYVCDRTVIEDTESSIEMGLHDWTLDNYPERLSYSATPPDFGSLVVQRRRWANGGLIIVPKLITLMRRQGRAGTHGRMIAAFLRFNYLASIAWATLGLMLLLVYPFDNRLLSPLVVLAALPYFVAQASDLKMCGYRRLDVVRIYGFNLLLLPVNLAGVLKSVNQAVTGRKSAFARTPKVKSRTTAPLSMILVPYALVVLSSYVVYRDLHKGDYQHAAFALLNATMA